MWWFRNYRLKWCRNEIIICCRRKHRSKTNIQLLHNNCLGCFEFTLVINYYRARLEAILEKIMIKTRQKLSYLWRKGIALRFRDCLLGIVLNRLRIVIGKINFTFFRTNTFMLFIIDIDSTLVVRGRVQRGSLLIFWRKTYYCLLFFRVALGIRRFRIVGVFFL